MKHFTNKARWAVFAVLSALTAFTYSCTHPLEGVTIDANTSGEKSYYTVIVKLSDMERLDSDGLAGGNVQITPVALGNSALTFVDKSGVEQTGYTTDSKGVFTMGVKADFTPSVSNPYTFALSIEPQSSDFQSLSLPITLNGADSTLYYNVDVLKAQQPDDNIDGIGIASFSGLDASSNSVNVEVPSTDGNVTTTASITIPAGLGSDISVDLALVTGNSEEAVKSIPGALTGLIDVSDDELNEDLEPVLFSTENVLTINMKSGNTPITSFGNESLIVDLGKDMTGQQLFSLSDGDVTWKNEGTITGSSFTTNHLTTFMIGSYVVLKNTSLQVTLSGNLNTGVEQSYRVKTIDVDEDKFVGYDFEVALITGGTFGMNLPQGKTVKLALFSGADLVGISSPLTSSSNSVTFTSTSSKSEIPATMNMGIPASGAEQIDFKVAGFCPNNKDVVVRPDAEIYYRQGSGDWSFAGRMVNGTLTTNKFVQGQQYEVWADVYVFGVYVASETTTWTFSGEATYEADLPETNSDVQRICE